jgi:iron(III) transport system substrate-binding protein
MNIIKAIAGLTTLLSVTIGIAASATTRLTVYTALESEQLAPYKKAFEADNPDIEIRWVRDSNGIVTARLLAERDNPQADVIWGVVASSLLQLEDQGLLLPYAPKGIELLKANFRDKAAVPSWVGMDAWMAAICFNTVEAARLSLPRPQSWSDLTKPVYRGQIVMPHPASSGTGYLAVSGWLQMMGEQAGWAFQDKLNDNVASYLHSGSKPCKMAASGEFPIGISMDYAGVVLRNAGAPIQVIIPTEGAGWDIEATAIVKGTKNPEAAKRLADWAASKKANELYLRFFAIAAFPGVKPQFSNDPTDAGAGLSPKVDLIWAARQRDAILAEWSRRYQGKIEGR